MPSDNGIPLKDCLRYLPTELQRGLIDDSYLPKQWEGFTACYNRTPPADCWSLWNALASEILCWWWRSRGWGHMQEFLFCFAILLVGGKTKGRYSWRVSFGWNSAFFNGMRGFSPKMDLERELNWQSAYSKVSLTWAEILIAFLGLCFPVSVPRFLEGCGWVSRVY